MSGVSQDWLIIGVFFAAFVLVTVGDVYWLTQKRSVPAKKALTVVFLSNFFTITLGFLVSFILFGILLAVAWDENTTMPGGEVGTWAALIAALGFPFLLMVAVRHLLIGGMRIEQISRPLLYAVLSTLIFFAAVLILPVLLLTALR